MTVIENFEHNYNTCVIMIIENHETNYTRVLTFNVNYLKRNGIEVILFFPKRIRENLLKFTKKHYFINWKLIEYSNASLFIEAYKVLDFVLKQSDKVFFIALNPATYLLNDAIYKSRFYCEYYPNSIILATDRHLSKHSLAACNREIAARLVQKLKLKKYGVSELIQNIMVETETVKNPFIFVPEINLKSTSSSKYRSIENRHLMTRFQVIFDWKNKKSTYLDFLEYSENFVQYAINSKSVFSKRFKIIALVQTFNESNRIGELLKNLEKLCDGIILYDDGSSDDTYEKIKSKKVLIKVKNERSEFNDLRNRNILLNLSSFINSEWYFLLMLMSFLILDILIYTHMPEIAIQMYWGFISLICGILRSSIGKIFMNRLTIFLKMACYSG